MSLKNRLSELEKCLKKFELCFELAWKTLKDFLTEEGILCRSPKSCLKEAFSMGLIQDEEEWLSIVEDRNLSAHTYDEALAEELYDRLPNHLKAMKDLVKTIKDFK